MRLVSKYSYIKIVLSLVCTFVFLNAQSLKYAMAQTQTMTPSDQEKVRNDCIPINMIIIVDQSNDFDQEGMRFESIKWFINLLGYDRLMNCPQVEHHVGVIGLSGEREDNDLGIAKTADTNEFRTAGATDGSGGPVDGLERPGGADGGIFRERRGGLPEPAFARTSAAGG